MLTYYHNTRLGNSHVGSYVGCRLAHELFAYDVDHMAQLVHILSV